MKKNKKIPLFRVFTLLSLAFLIGTAIPSFIHIDFVRSWQVLFYSTILLFLCAILNSILRNWPLALAAYFLIFLFLGMVNYSYFDYKHSPGLPYGQEVEIEGKIVRKPEIDYKKQQVYLEISSIKAADREIGFKKGSLILVQLPHYPACHYGDTLIFSGKIEKPGMIEDFDWGRYLERFLIFGVVLQPQNPIASSDALGAREKIYKALYGVSDRFENSINRILPEPHASLASGLILGIKRNIPDEFKDDLSITGLTHIIALSGYNITIIITVLSGILLGYLNRKQVLLAGLILIAGFVILTGASSSVVRAAIFSLLIIFGKTLGRQGDQTNLMILAALIMVLINPFVLASDVGFQLSFLAFSGLIFLSPLVGQTVDKSRFKLLPEYLKIPFVETLSAQIAVFPLILVVFGRVSLIGPISNVAVLWIVPWTMAVSFLAGLSGIVFYPLGKIVAGIAWPLLGYIINMVEMMAKFPMASIEIKTAGWQIGIILYLILIVVAIFLSRRFKFKY